MDNRIINLSVEALRTSWQMFLEVFWPLSLGFLISAIIQSRVSKHGLAKLLGRDNPKCFSIATLFGIASSSCSYAAVALARTLFSKGATFASSMIFELSSTNLVVELGIVLWVLLGWQFVLAEFLGGLIMIFFIALIFKLTLSRKLVEEARVQTQKRLAGRMEAHAGMEMTGNGFESIAQNYILDWASVWVDVVLGFIIAGVLVSFVPNFFWQRFFLINNSGLSPIIGPLIGPLLAVLSFVCSVGNIPLAAVLWRGGISFGGVISFIFADLIVLPILDIYRKYYGQRVMLYILVSFYTAMALAGYLVEILFGFLKITPQERNIHLVPTFNTGILNILLLVISAVLLVKFVRSGGVKMLKM